MRLLLVCAARAARSPAVGYLTSSRHSPCGGATRTEGSRTAAASTSAGQPAASPLAHGKQRPHQRSHHVVAERVRHHGRDRETVLVAPPVQAAQRLTVVAPSRRRQKAAKSCSPRKGRAASVMPGTSSGLKYQRVSRRRSGSARPDRRRPGRSSGATGRRTARRSLRAPPGGMDPYVRREDAGQPGQRPVGGRRPGGGGNVGVDHLPARVHPGVGAPGHGQRGGADSPSTRLSAPRASPARCAGRAGLPTRRIPIRRTNSRSGAEGPVARLPLPLPLLSLPFSYFVITWGSGGLGARPGRPTRRRPLGSSSPVVIVVIVGLVRRRPRRRGRPASSVSGASSVTAASAASSAAASGVSSVVAVLQPWPRKPGWRRRGGERGGGAWTRQPRRGQAR